MNVSTSVAWQTISSFLRGEVDHADEGTRQQIAHACHVMDTVAHKRLMAGQVDDVDAWDEHLCRVETREA